MENCIFCKIIKKEISGKIEIDNETVLAFHDIQPQAPFHVLVIPKRHIETPVELQQNELAAIFAAIKELAERFDLANGYRIVVNKGTDAGQAVPHVHFHLLGKRKLAWPPG